MSTDTTTALEKATARVESTAVSVTDGAVVPKTLDEQLKVAKWAFESGLLPEAIRSMAAAWLVMQRGAELGFSALASFDMLYVVKGRVRMTPNAVKAKALSSGLLEDAREELEGEKDNRLARVTVKRRGLPTPIVREFSILDAKRADLADGMNWKKYPDRMLLARARGFAYTDAFADLCGGLQVAETFDLEDGERVGDVEAPLKAATRAVPSKPDPLIAELVPKVEVEDSGVIPAKSPLEEHVMTHAEADAALACDHSCVMGWLIDKNKKPTGKTVVCSDCEKDVKLSGARVVLA